MKSHSLLAIVLAVAALAGPEVSLAADDDPGVITKVEKAVEHGVKAAASGVQRGARAPASGIERGAKAAASGVERGVKAAASGVERGAKATASAAGTVAKKVVGPSASAPGNSR